MKRTDTIVVTILVAVIGFIILIIIAAINSIEPPVVLEPAPPQQIPEPPIVEEPPDIEDEIEEDEIDESAPDPEPEPPIVELPPKYNYSCTYGEAFRIYRDIWEDETKHAIESDWGQIRLYRDGTIRLDKEAWSWLATIRRDAFLERVIPALEKACNPIEITIR